MSNTMEDTMAEAFCEEYLITWTEHGEELTGWLHKDISTRSNRMSQAGAINLFHPMDYDRLLIVTVFPDRSWIVHHEPTDGAQPTLGTREDEHRILDLIHQALEDLAGTPHQEDLDGRRSRLGQGQTNEPAGTRAETRAETRAPGITRVSGRAPGATATQPAQPEKPASPASPWRRPS